MSTEILMEFLKKGLIDLQGSDERLAKLQVTSEALRQVLTDNPSKALSYTLIALDPNAPENDPVVQETIAILEVNWATYFNAFSGTPIQIIRALLLQAIVLVAEENDHVAIAFVSIVRNVLPHIGVGNELDIWTNIISKFETVLNKKAEEEWATPEKISVKAFSYTSPKPIKISSSDVTLNRELLESGIAKASGPSNKLGQHTTGNKVWPNSADGWVHQFVPLLTTIIADVVDSALTQSKIEPIDLSKPLKELSIAVTNHIDSTLDAVSSATVGLQRRTSLIWWKESLYSQSAFCSYREMPTPIAATMMAFDLFNQVPTCSPASVSAFLYESILSITNHIEQEKISLAQAFNEMHQSKFTQALCEYINELFDRTEGRGPLLRLLRSGFNLDDKKNQQLIGISLDTQLSNAELAIWVFNELQAIRAVILGENEDD